jgi:hypothetical protein
MEYNNIYNFSIFAIAFHFFVLKAFYPAEIKLLDYNLHFLSNFSIFYFIFQVNLLMATMS